MTSQLPPIIKAAERLVVEVENAVRRFDRHHRYQIGAELRTKAMAVLDLAHRAWRDHERKERWVSQLVWTVDQLQHRLQVAKLLKATTSFRQFEHLLRLSVELGRQAGGWRKSLQHPNGQNARGGSAVAQRAKRLSTRAASAGATS